MSAMTTSGWKLAFSVATTGAVPVKRSEKRAKVAAPVSKKPTIAKPKKTKPTAKKGKPVKVTAQPVVDIKALQKKIKKIKEKVAKKMQERMTDA